jgi:hypothetical protein
MEFELFEDGTLTASWFTQKGSVTIDCEGHYIEKNDEVVMAAHGLTTFRDGEEAKVLVFAVGKNSGDSMEGTFYIAIDHPQLPNDTGTWRCYLQGE